MTVDRRELLGFAGLAAAGAPSIASIRSVTEAGPVGQGSDDTAVVAAAYRQLVAQGGGILYFPPGRYRINLELSSRTVSVLGAGQGATVLMPARRNLPVLRARYADAQWRYVRIADLTIEGAGASVGFMAGREPPQAGDQYSGRTFFENVGFHSLARALVRPAGQIGLTLRNCVFDTCEFHLWSRDYRDDDVIMHTGVVLAEGCWFGRASKAVIYTSGRVPGAGQMSFRDCVFERNPGCVLYIDGFNSIDGTPAIAMRDCWNEANGEAGSVSIDGRDVPASFAHLQDTVALFENTPLGPLSLSNTVVTTVDCALDLLRTIRRDDRSIVVHHRARGFGSYAPQGRVESVTAALQTTPGRALSFILPPRMAIASPECGSVLVAATDMTVLDVAGTQFASLDRPSRSPLPGGGTPVRLSLTADGTALIASAAAPGSTWLAWIFVCRLDDGNATLELTGSSGVAVPRDLEAEGWTTIGGYAALENPATSLSFRVRAGSRGARLTIAAAGLVALPSPQDAVNFINSRVFPLADHP